MTIAQFERDLFCLQTAGFVVLPGFVSEDQLAALLPPLTAFEAEVEHYAKTAGKVNFTHGWPLLTTRCAYCVSEELQALAMSQRVQAMAQTYLGGAVIRDCLLQTNMPDPRSQARGLGGRLSYHRDTLWKDGPILPSYLHAFILLTDLTAENGATFVVPGSHRLREPGYYFKHTEAGVREEGINYLVYDQAYFPSAVQILAPRGSLVFLDPMAIHSQGINVTAQRRTLVNITFRAASIVGNPPLLNARKLALEAARVPLRPDFLALLEDRAELPAHFGPLGTAPEVQPESTGQPVWERVVV
ncbi:MAG TPA: phytanoyl-CoA dioxygenase family protein [Ideonella sp.]|uniref:phytanoyl-CoA dioxygenase family protein n=1 Tax=Ideonella sp. TaxID=1929293 RepID=UPI002C3AC307|nr:phytanoyl-CoA dioxygenase family protein [Ideonella sp.]HSI50387.1 phytanoyl-CoA dioxygenase family protein [Ideonella sp.]